MKNRIDYVLTLLTIVVVVLTIHLMNRPAPRRINTPVSLEQARKLFPDAEKMIPGAEPIDWVQVIDRDGKTIAMMVASSPHSDRITGYGGSTPLLIAIEPGGNIQAILLLNNQETSSFVERVKASGFFDRWNGIHWKSVSDAPVDTITGATLTSSAVKKTMAHRLSLINPSASPAKKLPVAGFGWKDGVIILLTLSGTYLGLSRNKSVKKFRYWQLGLSVIVLGFVTGAAFSLALAVGWVKNGILPGGSWGILVMATLAVAVPVITGSNTHCFYVCPFGAFQEIIGKISPWKIKINKKLSGILRYVRYAALVVITLALVAGIAVDPGNLEPFSAFLIGSAGMAAIVIAVTSLLLSAGLNRPWCCYGCAPGALLDTLRRPNFNNATPSCSCSDECPPNNNTDKNQTQQEGQK